MSTPQNLPHVLGSVKQAAWATKLRNTAMKLLPQIHAATKIPVELLLEYAVSEVNADAWIACAAIPKDKGGGFYAWPVQDQNLFNMVKEGAERLARQREGTTLPPSFEKLFPYQKEGVRWLIDTSHALLADDMGLGKSAQSLVAAQAIGLDTLIVCPASLQINWKREAATWAPDLLQQGKIHIISHGKVILPDALQSKPFTAILDECHAFKNPNAKRSKDALKITEKADRVILLTGTPMLNRPAELYHPLKMIKAPCASWKWRNFAKRFCAGHDQVLFLKNDTTGEVEEKHFFEAKGATNVDELRKIIQGKTLRRLKKDVLKDLPEKTRYPLILQSDARIQKLLQEEYELKQKLDRGSATDEEKGCLFKIRAELADLKQPLCTQILLDEVQSGQKIVVFWHHTKALKAMYETLMQNGIHAVCFVGSMTSEERQKAVDSFQSEGGAQVILLSFGAGSTGLTLTASSRVLMCEVEWTPAIMNQAEDRLCRIGQKNAVTSVYLVYDNSLDMRMLGILQEKRELIGQFFEGEA